MKPCVAQHIGRWLDRAVNVFLGICLLAVLWIVLQVFVVTSFRIPSDSMEPTLEAGDAVLVEKWSYGPRLFNVWDAVDGQQVPIRRLPGWRGVKRNDVMVFNNPYPGEWFRVQMDVMQYYVKRCVALPGDTFYIRGGRYGVVGQEDGVGYRKGQEEMARCFADKEHPVDEVLLRAYPLDEKIGWTVLDFGPMYVPRAGDSISIDNRSFRLYKHLMEWEQGAPAEQQDSVFYLGGKPITGYRFRKNYYLAAGDKAVNSRDSRYWGFLPEEYIVGKVWRIWKSLDWKGEMRWERVGKKVE